MKLILLFFGICSLLVGMIGIVLPILPTTPFLLLALYLFTKSSKRLEDWFVETTIYHKHLKEFHQSHSMTLKQKVVILLFSDLMIIIAFILTDVLAVRVMLVLLELFKYWYFIVRIRTISKNNI